MYNFINISTHETYILRQEAVGSHRVPMSNICRFRYQEAELSRKQHFATNSASVHSVYIKWHQSANRVSHIILTTVWCKLVPFSIEYILLYILKYLMRVLIFFFLTCLDDNCKKKKNWQARWLKGVMTAIALCYSYVQLIWNKPTYFLWSRFGRLAITKWLANITDATGILQRHKEHIDDSF